MTQREDLKVQLEFISEDYRSPYGICSLISADLRELFRSLAEEWPEHSGDSMFPVPHPFLDPLEAYFRAGSEEMWNPEYPYAAARWRLIHFCIEELSE